GRTESGTEPVGPVGADVRQKGCAQGAPRVRRADRVEGVGEQREIALQLLWRAVARRLGPDPGPHEADFQAERLVRVAAAILLPHDGKLVTVALERSPQLG